MKTQPIHLRRGLTLYKQPLTPSSGSPNWYARVWMRIGDRCIHAKSTGTTDEQAARRSAEDLYAECLLQRRYGDALQSGQAPRVAAARRFDKVADDWLNQKMALAGSDRRKLRACSDARKLITAPNGLGAFFKRTDVGSIRTGTVRSYLGFAAKHSKKGKLATTTQRNHLGTLNGILKFAVERGDIAAAPPMPKLRLKDNPRPCFLDWEFRELCLCAGVESRSAAVRGEEAMADEWVELEDFLVFMVSTFLRAGEWKELRQKHCRIVYGEHPYLEVAVPNGKTHRRRVVSMPDAIPVFERILSRDGHDPERYLFKARYANRETAQERIRDRFDALLKVAGSSFDEFGNKRTIYSLRHTSLMFRLLQGDHVDLLMLAKNAGTSIGQLERFYLSHADPAMKVENLHSMKPQPEIPWVEQPEEPRSAINIRGSLEEPCTGPFGQEAFV